MVKKRIARTKTLFVDKEGIGRVIVDKRVLELLEWENKDNIEITCDLGKEEITIKRISKK